MPRKQGPQFTSISNQLAARMPTPNVPEEGVATAIRDTLYAARDAGILEPVSRIIEEQAKGDARVLALVEKLRAEG